MEEQVSLPHWTVQHCKILIFFKVICTFDKIKSKCYSLGCVYVYELIKLILKLTCGKTSQEWPKQS